MFSHLNDENLPHMVDISKKKACARKAVAQTLMDLDAEILAQFREGDIRTPKGAVFATAIIAGIQAVKNTPNLIPLCHTVPISHCSIDIETQENGIRIVCCVNSIYATGVEMEALIGCSMAALTVYDMCKSVHSNMRILETTLISKEKFYDHND